MLAAQILKFEEGFRSRPYYCTHRFPTIGYGMVVGPKNGPLPDMTITREQAEAGLLQRVEIVSRAIHKITEGLSEARRAILVSMAYQMGVDGLLKFRKALAAIKAGDFVAAESHMLDSDWAKQTPERAERHAKVMRTGTIEGVYDFKP